MEFYGRIGLHCVLLCCLWGRKDGFPGWNGILTSPTTIPIYGANGNTLTEGSTGVRKVNITTSGVLSGNTSKIYTIKHPLAFIYNTSSAGDWYTNNGSYQDDALWGDGEVKSAHDPCPSGWRVPTDASLTFGDLSTAGAWSGSGSKSANVANGGTYRHMAWFSSAVGHYQNGTSVLAVVGGYGYLWSSSVSDMTAKSIYTNVSGVVLSSFGRVYGFSIRCVQE